MYVQYLCIFFSGFYFFVWLAEGLFALALSVGGIAARLYEALPSGGLFFGNWGDLGDTLAFDIMDTEISNFNCKNICNFWQQLLVNDCYDYV